MTKGRREEKKIETEMAVEEGQDAKRRTGRRCAVGIASRRRKRRGGDGNRNKESRGRGGFELWKNSHFGTQKMLLLGRNGHPPPRRERKERNVYKEGRKKKWSEEEKWRKSGGKREGGARRQRGGIGLRVKRGESEQRHCRINIPFV